MRWTLVMLILFTFDVKGQGRISTMDSLDMRTKIEGFYSWYFGIIKSHRINQDFNPLFVKSSNGMTTLDFTNYIQGLKRFGFSDEFVARKIDDYNECNHNLLTIDFDKFSAFQDLDDFEAIKCDYSNRYEWTGGQEPKKGAILTTLTVLQNGTVTGEVEFQPEGSATVTFKRLQKTWMIDNLVLN